MVMRSIHATRHVKKGDSIPFDYEVGQPTDDVEIETTEGQGRGTITSTERQIFERIFADIQARGLQTTKREGHEGEQSTTNRSAMLIMQQAAQDAGQGEPPVTITAPALLSGAAKDRAKALLRFPPELRRAASKALDTIRYQATGHAQGQVDPSDYIDEGWKSPPHSFDRTIEVESKRHPERTRIEGLITSAETDIELWNILEAEVFTMPARLGIVKNDTREASSADSGTSTDATTDHDANPTAKPELPERLSLYVHGPLYPAYLLLALRQLNTAFSVPSPLVFSILPRIKELGLESYVLGVSTPFCNELLDIYWRRRGDLAGMLDLLEEMRHCGLYFDEGTRAILNQVDTATSGLAAGRNRSDFAMALMMMPEYEMSQRERIRYWVGAVNSSVEQKEQDMSYDV